MRYDLLDYQREAAVDVLGNLGRGRNDWNKYRSLSSFALSAITGAGKTVIASAVIEAILHGSSDLDVEADPKATFLWVTDDPALNRQTRNKMLDASDLLAPARLIILDNDFLDSQLSPGRVYFLNVQKLSKNSGLAQGGINLRQHSMWEVLANTINGGVADLYVVIDEAHRGMKQASDRKTIVQRIISGQQGSNPPAPVVWGISATIERFARAMNGGLSNRTSYPYVEVDIEKVRASGLIKDEIGLDQPDEKGTFSTTLLRDAVATTVDFERRWTSYSSAEDEPAVLPVLVIQVPDKATTTKLTEIVAVVESQWPGLGPRAIAHVLGEHETISLGNRIVEWVHPESIETETDIRVVLAKEAISTGWDCPRAEVLYSERPAKDVTHIAQVVGRMVRQPLAHRITTDDALNSVACYLPLFDRSALGAIKAELEGKGTGNGDNKVGPEVVRSPRVFERNPHIKQEVFDLIESLPSIPTPDALANPLRRAKNLARLLTDDASGKALLPNAGEVLTKTLNAKLDGLAAQFADDVEANSDDIKTAEIHRVRLTSTGQETGASTRTAATHVQDINRDTRKVIASVKEGVGKDYYAYRVEKAGERADKLEVRIAVASLLLVDGVLGELEATATKFVQDHLAKFAVEIKNTTGATRDAYRKVQEQTSQPEAVTVELRDNEKAATKDRTGADLPLVTGHIFAGVEGDYPVDLNDWETTVVHTETKRDSFVAWYRNPSRALPNALRIAYQDDAGKWGSLQVDFLVVSHRDDGALAVSIVDPHGDYLGDAKSKLRALADFADTYGHQFLRIESIAKVGEGALRYLDLQDPNTRNLVRKFEGGKVTALYESEAANNYL
jgi:type III restriction enzyme